MSYLKIVKNPILKATLVNMFFVSFLLLMGIISSWQYNNKGYIVLRWHTVYGSDAKFISLMLLATGSFAFCYFLFSIVNNLKNNTSRQRYLEKLLSNETYICVECEEVFFTKEGLKTCPFCESRNIEYCKGFYERYPEKSVIKEKNIPTQSSGADYADKELIVISVIAMAIVVLITFGTINYLFL